VSREKEKSFCHLFPVFLKNVTFLTQFFEKIGQKIGLEKFTFIWKNDILKGVGFTF